MAAQFGGKKVKKVVGFKTEAKANESHSGSESDRADEFEHMKEDLKEQKKKCAELRL